MRVLSLLALPLLLAACAQDESAPVDSTVEELTPGSTVAGDNASLADPAPASVTAPAGPIPPTMQGRWGLTAADCDPTRTAAEGLLVVEANGLQFYESRGVVEQVMMSGPYEVRARFSYIGEGMAWEREERLLLTDTRDGRRVLIRVQLDKEGEQRSYTYRRCS